MIRRERNSAFPRPKNGKCRNAIFRPQMVGRRRRGRRRRRNGGRRGWGLVVEILIRKPLYENEDGFLGNNRDIWESNSTPCTPPPNRKKQQKRRNTDRVVAGGWAGEKFREVDFVNMEYLKRVHLHIGSGATTIFPGDRRRRCWAATRGRHLPVHGKREYPGTGRIRY